jgi:hypothetical protein
MTTPTFRDFAMASMDGDGSAAVGLLESLLGVDEATARAGTAHFRAQMGSDPAFMMKAMGMRNVVDARDEGALARLIAECFGLRADVAASSAAVVLARYAQA